MRPFAGESEVNTKVRLRVRTHIGNDLREPRAADHDTARIYEPALEPFDERSVHGMGNCHIVSVHDEEPCRLCVPKPLGQVLVPLGRRRVCRLSLFLRSGPQQ